MSAGATNNQDSRGENDADHASKGNTLVLVALWIALVVVCCGGGMLASWVLLPDPQPNQRATETVAASRQSPGAAAANAAIALRPASLTTAQAITTARRDLYVEGNPDSALELYRLALNGMTQPPPLILLETATCFELIGQHAEAGKWYHKIANASQNANIVLVAELGEARCWLAAQQHELAATKFYELTIDPRIGRCIASGGPSAAAAKATAAEASYGLTHALTEPLLNVPLDLWLDDFVAAPPVFTASPDRLLRLLQELAALAGEPPADVPGTDEPAQVEHPRHSPILPVGAVAPVSMGISDHVATEVSLSDDGGRQTNARAGVNLVFQVSGKADEVQFSVGVAATPVLPLIDQLLDLAEQEGVWSDAVRTTLLGRTTTLDEPNISLGVLLDALLTPFGVVWRQSHQGGPIHFALAATLSAEDRMMKHHEQATRAGRHSIRAYPEHLSLPAAILSVGNLLFLERNLDAAAAQYEMVLRHHGQSDTAPRAWFNLAKIHLHQRRDEAALAAFYRVVDGARGGELRHVAALYAGRIHLEHEQLLQGSRILRRARTMTTTMSVEAAAAILQATVLLREENPHAATTVLMESKPALAIHRRDIAALLGAMARFQTATSEDKRLVHGRLLVSALGHATADEYFGRYGSVLLGEAYAELGLYDEMSEAYQMALDDGISGMTAERMRLALARVRRDQGDYDDASMLYQQLTANAAKEEVRRPTIILAMIEQAELEFQLRHNDRCLEVCKLLLDEATNDANKARVLQLMGRTYSRLGDHSRAALCFAGMRPNNLTPMTTEESNP